jgi:hypothetical protein
MMTEQQRCAIEFVFGLEKVDQKPYNSSIKTMEFGAQRFSSTEKISHEPFCR